MNVWKKSGKLAILGILAVSLAACGAKPADNTGSANSGAAGQTDSGKKQSDYPKKPVTMVVPNSPGGSWDIAGRAIVKVLLESKMVNVQLPVENKPGGSGATFMAEFATKDTKDDYKIFVNSPSLLINNLRKEARSPFGYKDTTPLAQLFRDYGVIAVSADSKYKDLKTLFDDLKKSPDSLSIGGGSAPGSLWHLNMAIGANNYGIDLRKLKYVSFNGNAESMTALLGGHVQVLSSGASDVKEYLRSGKIRVLALNAPKRLDGEFKDVPTLEELGIKGDFSIWRGVFGAKEMTKDAKEYWDATLKKLSENPQWQQEMKNQGWEPDYKNADDFKKALDQQNKEIESVLKILDMAG